MTGATSTGGGSPSDAPDAGRARTAVRALLVSLLGALAWLLLALLGSPSAHADTGAAPPPAGAPQGPSLVGAVERPVRPALDRVVPSGGRAHQDASRPQPAPATRPLLPAVTHAVTRQATAVTRTVTGAMTQRVTGAPAQSVRRPVTQSVVRATTGVATNAVTAVQPLLPDAVATPARPVATLVGPVASLATATVGSVDAVVVRAVGTVAGPLVTGTVEPLLRAVVGPAPDPTAARPVAERAALPTRTAPTDHIARRRAPSPVRRLPRPSAASERAAHHGPGDLRPGVRTAVPTHPVAGAERLPTSPLPAGPVPDRAPAAPVSSPAGPAADAVPTGGPVPVRLRSDRLAGPSTPPARAGVVTDPGFSPD